MNLSIMELMIVHEALEILIKDTGSHDLTIKAALMLKARVDTCLKEIGVEFEE